MGIILRGLVDASNYLILLKRQLFFSSV